MDEDTLNDLKKFIAFAILQQISDVRDDIKRLEKKMDAIFQSLDNKIDDLSDSGAQAIHDSNDEVDKQLQDHEARITKLAANPA